MSGPVSTVDAPAEPARGEPMSVCIETSTSSEAVVGGMRVRRALPRRGRRTVGAWCFADHMGPADVTEGSGLDIGPHPHIGLQTVTWLVDGQLLHRDSLGSEQVIAPGQLNLMTAGAGVTHSEETSGHYSGRLEGIQLWVAQPETTRHGTPAFEHHDALPQVELANATATVLVGDLGPEASPARHDTPLVGLDLDCHEGATDLPLHPAWEHAVVVLRGSATIGPHTLRPGQLGYLGDGRDELRLRAERGTRLLLLGGEPFGEEIVMWWNFVARSRDELDAAFASWRDGDDRFGRVGSPLARIPAPEPYWHQAR